MRMLVIALVAACGGGVKKEETAPPKIDTTSCTAVSESMVAALMQDKEVKGNIEARADDIRAMIRKRCEQDAWTAEARQCIVKMQSNEDAIRCNEMLTPEQRDGLVREQDQQLGTKSEPVQPAAEQTEPATTGAPPPPPAPAPSSLRANEAPKETTKDAPAKSKAAKGSKKTGDPCDGGE
jgi:hypothetical protein